MMAENLVKQQATPMEKAVDKSMTVENFSYLCQVVKESSGLVLDENKRYLVETRLPTVAKTFGCETLDRLIESLKGPMSLKVRSEIVEAMATPETFFFRDKHPFDQFKSYVLPRVMEKKGHQKNISVWCCASSSGQEPYSIAMIFDELQQTLLKDWRCNILATDFSTKILQKAQEGIYSQFEVQRGLPIQYLMKHFTQDGQRWLLKDSLKRMVTFKNHNLMNNPMMFGKFDVIFCRNVLFYFDLETKRKVLDFLYSALNPGGMLFVGSAETTVGVSEKFVHAPEQRGIYMRVEE